jgi:hypothetical protein
MDDKNIKTNLIKSANAIVSNVAEIATETGKKGKDIASGALAHTVSGSKMLASEIKKGAKDISDKNKENRYNKRLQKFNPLFEDEYKSPSFHLPNIICIVDEAIRRDIDVCEGAIGWREMKQNEEVLYLYDEYIQQSGITFVPNATCNAIYYVDVFDRTRYINTDSIFQFSHDAKVAELENIARCLGAKKCTIHMVNQERQRDKRMSQSDTNVKVPYMGKNSVAVGEKSESASDYMTKFESKSEAVFKGLRKAEMPELKWFAHDPNIQNLINFRLTEGKKISSKELQLSGASSATLSRKTAVSIDAVAKDMGVKQSNSLETKSVKESSQTIYYYLQ